MRGDMGVKGVERGQRDEKMEDMFNIKGEIKADQDHSVNMTCTNLLKHVSKTLFE